MNDALSEAREAGRLARLLVDQEHRRGNDRICARRNVARAVGASPGTIENLQRDRLKQIAGWLRDALRARVIRELEAEIKRLEHELAIHKQTAMDSHHREAAAINADLSTIRRVLARKPI